MCWPGCMTGDAIDLAPDGTRERRDAFAAALAGMGLASAVEDRDGLAVIHPAADVMGRLADPILRRRVVGLGRTHGFTHVAVTVGHT